MWTPTEMQEHALDFVGWSIRLIIFLLALAVIVCIIGSFANAAECQSSAGGGGYWQWRYVKPYEHKRCWYRGHHQLPKSDLYWSIMKPEKQFMDPVFPKHLKVVTGNEYTELDAQAGKELYFSGNPLNLWPTIMRLTPFIPWTDRVVGAFK